MSYFVHISDRDQAYLDGLPLSDTAKERVDDFIDYAIANVNDSFRNDSANRPYPNDHFFQVEFLLLDSWGDGSYHRITFVISDEHAAAGVLLIVFVDHQ